MQNYRNNYILLSILFLIVFPTITHAQSNLSAISWKQSIAPEKNYVEGEVIVKYKDTTVTTNTKDAQSTELIQTLKKNAQTNDIRLEENFTDLNIAVITSETKSTQKLITEIENNDNVEYVEPNYRRYPAFTPNDTYFYAQWAHYNTNDADIDSTNMWDIEDVNAQNTLVAVIDSGLHYSETELSQNVWNGSAYCVDDTGIEIIGGCPNHGWDYADNDNDPDDTEYTSDDYQGHGTFVSSIINAQTNNNSGIAGISRYNNIKIMALRFNFNVASELKAIDFAKNNRAKVINASFGGSSFSQGEKNAIDAFPGIIVTAAGNGGIDEIGDNNDATPSYPCNYTSINIICVGASDDNDYLSSFSNYGKISVDLVAPGDDIVGLGYKSTGGWKYYIGPGTSFSTPHVAGSAAILYAHNNTLTNTQVRDLILTNVDNKSSLSDKVVTSGRLNAYKSLHNLLFAPIRSNGAPSGTLNSDTTHTTLSLTTNENSTCKYSTTQNQNYDLMPHTFSTTNSQSHTTAVSGLTNGNTYTYYIKCRAGIGNKNTTDYVISFSVNPETTPVYRFWNKKNKSHFYTKSEEEKDYIITNYDEYTWKYEGIAYYAPSDDISRATPVYRFWSSKHKGHFYTASLEERNYVIEHYDIDTWKYEGIAYYAYPTQQANTKSVYRFWSKKHKHHFYTASEEEKNYIIANYDAYVWEYEGTAWYVPN